VEEYAMGSEAQNRENGRSLCARWRVGFCTAYNWRRGKMERWRYIGMRTIVFLIRLDKLEAELVSLLIEYVSAID
jgi:hypothetical protein